MWLQMNAALRRAWLSTSSLQIGIGDVQAALDGLDASDDRLVSALADGIDEAAYARLARRLGVSKARSLELVRALRSSGVLIPHRHGSPPDRAGPAQASLIYGCHSDDLAADRASRSICVLGREPMTTAIADRLCSGGVGHVTVEPEVPRDTRDLCIVVGNDLIHPVLARDLLRRDQPHLAVVVTEAGGTIGPLVVPGSTCCLRCVELYRRDRQPWWPVVAAQLCLPGSSSFMDAPPIDDAVVAALSALAAVHALTFVDGYVMPASYSATVELSIAAGTTSTTPLPAYPDCGCTWPLPTADCSVPRGTDFPPRIPRVADRSATPA